ncbi:hypothetical protein GUITHDRAFT_147044 [Guillardia theta CCMP2712]|uniref:Uncharacterized protein n=1 Tax=Guillardia theta (strain CCMP2712) TaxID=905079 RepID=L1IFW9_GUITC|nr:hypothetical protein GUITHDRAFT_147044 [Guillardia theta CCMP2712]EKX34730.1 hypothetical protein GUITHDRAFT_147044 [Guillardia theta CCMP2712]|eukprot:XP_005821710.1 hypothetical protein GUITHDRAFT_147044 [Guillardia theta CCMP2712]
MICSSFVSSCFPCLSSSHFLSIPVLPSIQLSPLLTAVAPDSHEFNWETMDMSHTVNHLSFGPFLSETDWLVLPPHIAHSVGSLDDKEFTSDQHIPTTHEHYIKVVKHEVTPPSSWRIPPVTSYG